MSGYQFAWKHTKENVTFGLFDASLINLLNDIQDLWGTLQDNV